MILVLEVCGRRGWLMMLVLEVCGRRGWADVGTGGGWSLWVG